MMKILPPTRNGTANNHYRPTVDYPEDRVVPTHLTATDSLEDHVIPADESGPIFENFLGHALQVVRVASGFSQERLADALGLKLGKRIRQTYISKIEKGRNKVTLKRLGLLCEILHVSPAYVVDMAVSLAEQGSAPNDTFLRDTLATVTKRLAANSTPPPVKKLLLALQAEINQRLSEREAQSSGEQPARPKKRTKTTAG